MNCKCMLAFPLVLLSVTQQKKSDMLGLQWWIWLLILVGIILLLWLILYCIKHCGKKVRKITPVIPHKMAEQVAEPEPEPVKEVDAAQSPEPMEKETSSIKNAYYDDLKLIEGIGPKISTILQGAGVTTFAQLAELSPEAVREILIRAGIRLVDTTTWPEQARLAADGKMDALKNLQDSLKGGRAS